MKDTAQGKNGPKTAAGYSLDAIETVPDSEGNAAPAYIGEAVDTLRRTFRSGKTKSIEWREQQLDGLIAMIQENEEAIVQAIHEDVGRTPFEAWLAEVTGVVTRLKVYRKKLRRWVKPKRVSTIPIIQPAKSVIIKEPLGVVLVISPWNFPIELGISPLAGAIAAGNAVLLKPSEHAPKVAALLGTLIPKYLDGDAVKVLEGGVPETTALLKQKFDHIFYTGSGRVARIVMEAAAKHLTPLTLELGGKNPTIVDASANLKVTARRVLWGKLMNAGQLCVATDYLLAHEAIYDDLLKTLKETLTEFYGEDPKSSPDYGRIINAEHHRRLMRLMATGGTVYHGGASDESDRYIAPTLLTDVPDDAPIMAEEIFGPLLPVLKVASVDEAIAFVNEKPKPLALYVFTGDKAVYEKVLAETSSGGAGVNCVLYQLLGFSLPFGGVGASGMGKYHGPYSIDTFSNLRGVVNKGTRIDPSITYPPIDETKKKRLKRFF